jgi:hypothetical protein
MDFLTLFLGIIIFIILFIGLLYLYNKLLGGAIIYDLKKTNQGIPVDKPNSPNYYFSVWIYVNSFVNENINNDSNTPKYDPQFAETGKPIFYYGESFDESGTYVLDKTNTKSKELVYLQLGANSPKLQYYYSIDNTSAYKFINITESLPIQKWTHVIINTTGSVLEFYLDGKLIKTITETAPKVTANVNSLIQLGRRTNNISHDTFISRIQRVPKSVDAKTAYNLFKKGPGTGLNMGNMSKYDLSLQVSKNNNVIKTYSTK